MKDPGGLTRQFRKVNNQQSFGARLASALLLAGLFQLSSGCSEKLQQSPVLARVGDRSITVNDFLDRTSLTIRPAFLSATAANEKKLLLNGLIAEKLLAIEAARDTQITRRHKMQQYVTGITEQKMRELHFRKEALDAVNPPEEMVNAAAGAAGKSYELSYFDLPTTANANSIAPDLAVNTEAFTRTFEHFYPGQKLRHRTVTWQDVLNEPIFDELYLKQAQAGQIIGPVEREDGRVFFFRVNSWKSTVSLSETDRSQIRKQVNDKIRRQLAFRRYDEIISKLMAGKQLQFIPDGLVRMANLLGPVYIGDNDQFQLDPLIDPSRQLLQEVRLDSLRRNAAQWENQPVLRIDGATWSIGDLLAAMERHPLVFHQKHFPRNQFGSQMQLALVDLIRDQYINKQCYKQGYDKAIEVIQTRQLWQDYFYAAMQRTKLLATAPDSTAGGMRYLNEIVRGLRQKYAGQIQINSELLNKTEPADVQLFALQKDVPFPVALPAFPALTTDDH